MRRRDTLGATALRLKTHYWPLIKSRQTFLLLLTGLAGYLCGRPFPINWTQFLCLTGSLAFTIAGCTSLNMVFDRDIDRAMARTRERPLPSNQVSPDSATTLGGGLMVLGLLFAMPLTRLFFWLAILGAGLQVLVYTLWLKRRSAWSILWGGLAGGIPVLAGRALALGRVDAPGVLLAAAIVCWIPSHNLTLDMLHAQDYRQAGVPIFPNVYGMSATHRLIALSGLLTAGVTSTAFHLLHLSLAGQVLLALAGLGLLGLAAWAWTRPSRQANLIHYKVSSFYLLAVMLLLALEAFI